jgi:hypothetical protein
MNCLKNNGKRKIIFVNPTQLETIDVYLHAGADVVELADGPID